MRQPYRCMGIGAVALTISITAAHAESDYRLLVGLPTARLNTAGSVQVFNQTPLSAHLTVVGNTDLDLFGFAASWIGDIDGDGHDDFAVSAPLAHTPTLIHAGTVSIHSGFDGTLLRELHGLGNYQFAGWMLASAGDINADGVPDVLVGGWTYGVSQDPIGQVIAYCGQTAGVLRFFTSDSVGDGFGFAACGLGDVDGDGAADIAISAPLAANQGGPAGRVYIFHSAALPSGTAASATDAAAIIVNSHADDLFFGSILLPTCADPTEQQVVVGAFGADSAVQANRQSSCFGPIPRRPALTPARVRKSSRRSMAM